MPTASRPPLGLPRGSVRALLTLMIVAVIVIEAARGREVPLLWTETLMIALAHYFTSRRFVQLAPEVLERLETEGHLPQESHPLYLPRHTIRCVIILAFLGLAAYLYYDNRLLAPQSRTILGTVFAYFLGLLAGGFVGWWNQGQEAPTGNLWNDLKAAAVLLITAVTAGLYLADRPDLVIPLLRNSALGLVLFYFGSR